MKKSEFIFIFIFSSICALISILAYKYIPLLIIYPFVESILVFLVFLILTFTYVYKDSSKDLMVVFLIFYSILKLFGMYFFLEEHSIRFFLYFLITGVFSNYLAISGLTRKDKLAWVFFLIAGGIMNEVFMLLFIE